MASKSTPLVLAIQVCDFIYVDPASQRRSLMGVHSGGRIPAAPCILPYFAVQVDVTECLGDYDTLLRVVGLSDEESVLIEHSSQFTSENPRAYYSISLQVFDFEIPDAGEYLVECLVDGKLICDRRIQYEVMGG